jgi:hypothetical protein
VHAKNVEKYKPIASSYQNKYGSAKVITIMFPTAGTVPMVILEALKECGIKAVKVIKGTYKIANGLAAANAADEYVERTLTRKLYIFCAKPEFTCF